MPSGVEQAVGDDRLVRPPGDLLDEQPEQAVVEVRVRVLACPARVRRPRDSPTLPAAGHESTWPRKNIDWYDSKPGRVRQQLAHGDGGDLRVGDRGADDVGEALADRLVEPELAGLDELQHDDRRDHLADAGDPEAVARLDRLGGRARARSSSWSSMAGVDGRRRDGRRRRHGRRRHAEAEVGGVHDLAVDGDGDADGVVAAADQARREGLVERRPSLGRGRRARRRGRGGSDRNRPSTPWRPNPRDRRRCRPATARAGRPPPPPRRPAAPRSAAARTGTRPREALCSAEQAASATTVSANAALRRLPLTPP